MNYKDLDYLKEECIDGRELGFTGKVSVSLFLGGNSYLESDHSKPYILLKWTLFS